jgi:hypothetical protein
MMWTDPEDGGLDDWVAPALAPVRPAGERASVMRTDPQDGGLDDWIAPAPLSSRPAGEGASVMRIDPRDGGLDDWIAPEPAPIRLAGQGAPVTAIDPRDGGLDDWIAPAPALNRPAGQGASVMRIDPQSGVVSADPSQWWQTRALPRIIVHPKPPNASPDNPAGADWIDDWFVPGQAPAGADGRMIGSCRPPRAPTPPLLTIGPYWRRARLRAPHNLRQAPGPTLPIPSSPIRPRCGPIPLGTIGRLSRPAASAQWPGTRRSFPIPSDSFHCRHPGGLALRGSTRRRACSGP